LNASPSVTDLLQFDELRRHLVACGLRSGDQVVVHSSLRALGRVAGGADTVVDALLDVIGQEGCLVAPAFSYRVATDGITDLAMTHARTGAVPEAMRQRPGCIRSDHPTHSVVALGAGAEDLLVDHVTGRTMGPQSPLGKLASADGRILLLGVGHTSNTMIHIAEEMAGLPKPPPPEGSPTVNVRAADGRTLSCALDSSPSCSAAFGAIEAPLRSGSFIRDGRVGEALCQFMSAKDVLGVAIQLMKSRPDALLCTRENCGPCQRTRTALAHR
jgi:aminoglycoside 3-N-acetyltransferase